MIDRRPTDAASPPQRVGDILETISDAFFALDAEWRFTYVNQAAERLLGRRRDELLGRTLWSEFPEAVGTTFDHEYHRAMSESVTAQFVAFYPPLEAWFEVRAYPTPGGLAVYFRNINDQKQMMDALLESEARFRQLADAMPQIVFAAQPDGHVDYFNKQWYAYTGLPDGSTGYESWKHVHVAEGLERVSAVWTESLRTGKPYEIEYRLRRFDGALRWHLGRALPVKDAEGNVVRWFGTNTDIHDYKLTQQRLDEERQVVETINQVGQSLAAELDVQQLVQSITDATTRLSRAAFGAFFYNVVNEKGETYSLYALSGAPREAFANFPMPRMTDVFGSTFRGEGIVRSDDITKDPRYGRNAPRSGMPAGHLPVRSYLAAPVVSRTGAVIGGLFFGHPETGVFTEREERIVAGIAAQAAVAIDNARLYEAVREGRRTSEQNLAQLQAVVGSMAEGVVIAEPGGRLLDWNQAALAIHGFHDVEQARQKLADLHNLFELRTTDGRPVPVEDWPMQRAMRGEKCTRVEVELLRRDTGKRSIVSYSGTPIFDRDGKQVLALLTLHDITEERRAQAALRENEARLQLALAIAQMGTFEIDLRTDAVAVNDAGREIYGWAVGEPLTFAKVQSHFHPEDRERVVRAVGAAFEPAGPGEFEVEQRIIRTDGHTRWIRVRGRALFERGRNGREPVRCVGTYIDITEQKQAEHERETLLQAERAARGEAERANRMKDEFLSTVSHELRTPLNAMLGWSQILRSPRTSPNDIPQGLEVIERNARAQAAIIEDLLDMSRIITGKVRLDVQRVELAGVIRAALASLQPAADAKGIRLHAVLDPHAGPVSGDPDRLQQVVWNLVSNAVKFTPRGGRVSIVLERVSSHVEISVSDTGEGIEPDFLPHVFDRFRQAEGSTTRRHGGLGLGLAIVKHLVELHGGAIHAKSPGKDQGATFRVSLPLLPVHDNPHEPERPPHPTAERELAEPSDTPTLTGLSLLVIDDDADARLLMDRLLVSCGATVTTAASADEGLAALDATRFDVIVSDIGMPERDGYAFVQDLRARSDDGGGKTPAIALTAMARSQDRTRAMLAGFDAHVAKPVDPVELCAIIARLGGRAG